MKAAAEMAGDAVEPAVCFSNPEALQSASEGIQGILVVDGAALDGLDIYEWSLDYLRRSRALLFLLTRGNAADAEGLARFVGAQGALELPLDIAALADRLRSPFGLSLVTPEDNLPVEGPLGEHLERAFLEDREASVRERFLQSVTDPETHLFTAPFWEHRLDEEFKRSSRFRYPLGLVRFSHEGALDPATLLKVSGVILLDTRDVDIVARYDTQVFLALLPHTGPAGTQRFGERVIQGLASEKLADILGENLEWDFAFAACPDSEIRSAKEFLDKVMPSRDGLPA
ncbi:MAG: hypothetical protein DWQ01_18935 [Planctomycetota bacterium]|nr:MAG: hypothetical protein DWQ01_18935 [Planctomycetota bacterium]